MFKALVVDDHPFIRAAIKALLLKEKIEVIAEGANGAEALRLARELQPDLIVLDISMPQLDGLEVIHRLASFGVKSKILVLTSLSPQFYATRCMNAGAAGFVSKTNDLNDLSRAVQLLMSGYTFFPNLANSSVRRSDAQGSEADIIACLSDREMLILQQLSQGYSNKEIGEAMLLSNKTISAYKTRLIEKLNVKSVVALADFAKRNDLI
ncbi:response regulator transcription factor [Pseudomonas chlororaphis]|uniref:Two-component response regulator n=1 Tax=Pseudomonas chlororaphis TaxID=587753 RepID=A0AAX3FWJ6_9PSED|nr:response regulator transcription factor [Pseudomonas chlororaphis]AVO61313.1 DNA-binding response regulator [Pseudomonas chlororaphis subsp. piscium]AZC40055.1 DNA-binding response regulator, LuxR family [Pseudomonas chlororaphis subsp. piscium]AZC46612.1 DNA-binding response regulator, LuxR family [Pseudomonas chlororaphis subsp. piscium]AZC53300.1 DNA-binding response regulator, LuxR family [Pseudomonas chlororaphis subsp. piscium]AZC59597.1 DNA-binding response regulator, LuxR family [Ps